MMDHGEVAVGNHGASTIPIALADDVNGADIEGVGGANNRTNVEIMLPILNRNLQFMALGVEIGDDCLNFPISVMIKDVAAVP